jgi:hypothetical protein
MPKCRLGKDDAGIADLGNARVYLMLNRSPVDLPQGGLRG